MEITELKGNGDFRSEECIEFLKQADVVVTNPPFSLFREYVKQLMDYNKKFIIIGNQNAIGDRDIFPYIKNNELWMGVSMNGSNRWFSVPDNYPVQENAAGFKVVNGKKMFFVNGVTWFTNIENKRRNDFLDLYRHYNSIDYPKYDNYDAIEVSKATEIPMDYNGAMGVPITFLYKFNPKQFEIIWKSGDIEWAENECDFFTPPTEEQAKIFKKQNSTWRKQNPYFVENGVAKTIYTRIFIRRK